MTLDGWQNINLAEILTESRIPVIVDNASKRLKVRLHVQGVCKREERATDRTDATMYFQRRAGQFIYGKQNLHKGAIGIVPDELDGFASTQDIPAFDISSEVDAKWLFYYFSRPKFFKSLEFISTGTGSKRIQPKALLNENIQVPPLPEQKKIAAILSSVDDAIQATQAVIDQTRKVKQGLLQPLLTRGIGHTRFKQSEIGEIPEGWKLVYIYEMSEKSRNCFNIGPFGSNLIKDDYRDKGVPVVFVRDIKPNQFVWKSNVFVDSEKAIELTAHAVKANDVVITKMGMPPGIAAVFPEEMPEGIITADIIRLRPNRDIVNPDFLSEILNAPIIANQVIRLTAGQTRPKLTLRDYKTIKIPLPPLHEQEQIVSALVSVSNLCKSEEIKLEQLSIIKRGLMQDLLTGRVRVKPDEVNTT